MSSYQKPVFNKSLLAAVSLAAKQFYYVGENAAGAINVKGAAAGAIGMGFLQNTPLAGEACEIMTIGGGAKGVLSEAVTTYGTELKAIAAGTLDIADTAGDIVVAISLDTGVSGDIIEVQPVLYRKHA